MPNSIHAIASILSLSLAATPALAQVNEPKSGSAADADGVGISDAGHRERSFHRHHSAYQRAGKARVKGAEAKTVLRPIRDFVVRMSVSLLDAKYRDFPNAQVTIPNPKTGKLANLQVIRDVSCSLAIRPFSKEKNDYSIS